MPLDPHAKRLLDKLASLDPPSADRLTVDERRAALKDLLEFSGRLEQVGKIENRSIPGAASPLRVRIYSPAPAASQVLPGLVYFHGGGLVAGDLDTHDFISRSLANATGCRLMSVEYRLAPEHRFPAAVEDGYAAICFIAAHADEFSIDQEQLVVGGDSAGATLAAVVCKKAADAGSPPVALQLLICPILDFSAETESRRSYARGYLMDEATLAHDLKYYLQPGVDPTDPRISPLRVNDVSVLPQACIHTAECDPLRDEGRIYSDRLNLAGVKTIYRCHSGMIHLFYGMGMLIPYVATAYKLIGVDVRAMLR
jgi:acetyl esterase